jgi:hypothetical protein
LVPQNTDLSHTITKTSKQYEVSLILNLPSNKTVNIKHKGAMNTTSKTSGYEETFHTDVVV